MTRLERYFFRPVPALRVFVVVRAVLLINMIDALRLAYVAQHTRRFDADGLAIEHFALLDLIQPQPTTLLRTTVFVGMATAAGIAMLRPRRWLLALVAALQTWSWMMSIHDNFQHHYFISIVLGLLLLLPNVSWASCKDGRTIEAGGFVVLAASIGVTYAFTAIAKLDPVWVGGALLRHLAPSSTTVIPTDLAALGIIALEIYLAVAYVRAPRPRSYGPFVAALFFHASAEIILDLSIGAFSYDMIALAIAFLAPLPISIQKKERAQGGVLQYDANHCAPRRGPSLVVGARSR